jgi:hypothetical protein
VDIYVYKNKVCVEKLVREGDLIRESVRLRKVSPDMLLRSLEDLNNYIVESTKAGIRMREPKLNKEEADRELRRAFS